MLQRLDYKGCLFSLTLNLNPKAKPKIFEKVHKKRSHQKYCCNLSGGVALIVWFTTNGMCVKNNTIIYVARASNSKRLWAWSLLLLAATVRSFAHAARNFRSQQNGAVTRMWRSCRVQPSHKERAIGVVRCKKDGMLLQPLRWCCVDCVIHHERDVREE